MEILRKYFGLNGEVAVITGAAGLLGENHAEAILDAGGNVVLLDINEERLRKATDRLSKKYDRNKVYSLVVNITIEEEIEKAKVKILERFNRVDILINNATNNPSMKENSDAKYSRLESFDSGTWDRDISVGLTGSFYCSKIFGTVMAKQKKGVILNISSDLGIIGPDQRLYTKEGLLDEEQAVKPITYSVVKTGILGLTRYLATYWGDLNVRTNAVAFGGVYNNQDKQFLDRVKERIPMARMANDDEYKATIIYLCSQASSYMNGSTVVIDGGRTIW